MIEKRIVERQKSVAGFELRRIFCAKMKGVATDITPDLGADRWRCDRRDRSIDRWARHARGLDRQYHCWLARGLNRHQAAGHLVPVVGSMALLPAIIGTVILVFVVSLVIGMMRNRRHSS